MKKRIVSAALSAIVALSPAFTIAETAKNSDKFTPIYISCPEGEELWAKSYQEFSRLMLRYADTKEKIPTSEYSDGLMYAYIPVENANREVETFVAPEVVFTDDDDSFEIHIMEQAAVKGVINGSDDGKALPYDVATRAEATAMALRMIGKSSSDAPAPEFDDVTESDWFYTAVAAAKSFGIVTGDDEKTFSPNRSVTKEEMVTMFARAAQYADLCELDNSATAQEVKEVFNIEDAEKISGWAKGAYKFLKYCAPYTDVETDEKDEEDGFIYKNYANPQTYATRFDTAYCAWKILDRNIVIPTLTAIEYGFDKNMPVIDGSTSTYPFTDAVYQSLFLRGMNHKQKPAKHSKSHASYERLINGEVDMLFASVYPASDVLELAKENDVELELIPIAHDAMVFFTNAKNPATGLTSEQISKIYVENAYENWSEIGGEDALLYPYCRNNDSGSHAQMERHFLNGNEINEKIRNETTSISMSNVLTDVMGAQTENPKGYGLGYSIYYYFNNMDLFYDTKTNLKLLAIDGVYPTDETIADSSYPLSNNTYVVLRKDTPKDAPARKMAEFMLTPQGQACVSAAGFGPLKSISDLY